MASKYITMKVTYQLSEHLDQDIVGLSYLRRSERSKEILPVAIHTAI